MFLFFKKVSVPYGFKAIIFKNNKLDRELGEGVHYFFQIPFIVDYKVLFIPLREKLITVTNQEVSTKDRINVKFSYYIIYRITNAKALLEKYICFDSDYFRFSSVGFEGDLHIKSQVLIREMFSRVEVESIVSEKANISTKFLDELKEIFKNTGVEILDAKVRDITYPKHIQEIFSRQLDAKFKASADLENARTEVATARVLKNVATMLRDAPEIKFLKYINALESIVKSGRGVINFNGEEVKTLC